MAMPLNKLLKGVGMIMGAKTWQDRFNEMAQEEAKQRELAKMAHDMAAKQQAERAAERAGWEPGMVMASTGDSMSMDGIRSRMDQMQRHINAAHGERDVWRRECEHSRINADTSRRLTERLTNGIKQDLQQVRKTCGTGCDCDTYPGPDCPNNPMKHAMAALVAISLEATAPEPVPSAEGAQAARPMTGILTGRLYPGGGGGTSI